MPVQRSSLLEIVKRLCFGNLDLNFKIKFGLGKEFGDKYLHLIVFQSYENMVDGSVFPVCFHDFTFL